MTQTAPAPVVLYCKSYEGDLKRVARLVSSIRRFNVGTLPLYISVPAKDRLLFEQHIPAATEIDNPFGTHIHWLSDEDIVAAMPDPDKALEKYRSWDGRLSQQVVKSEFWRLGLCDAYVCLDSDSVFIREFDRNTFCSPQTGTPYSVMYQSKELLQLAENRRIDKILTNFLNDSETGKQIFGRQGPDYDFSPTPVIWSAKVWRDLAENELSPQEMTLWDAIEKFPSELRWYGETLLKYQSIPLIPIDPLFRVYHYDWQYARLKRLGESTESLKKLYWGVVMQSNWDYEMDYGAQAKRKSPLSRMARSMRRAMARYR